ncbi:hypothetical protein EGR_09065 [Echinococcus granulosus]|uniref:Uncharacterized protein n=1 Tax=Echinococcus granulosus TaxID=6210 RepID=W6U4M2_ECHGR|nr:hypothetical protein EGR_09065 [Echinococcus granulosus]EUB56075.1 hypothetical protein EGR_09065 [Echinococcus granulosus]
MDSDLADFISKAYSKLAEGNGGSQSEGEVQHQTSLDTMDTLKMSLERLKAFCSSELNPGKNTKEGVFGALDSKDSDAAKMKLKLDALAEQTANLTIQLSNLKDAYSSMEHSTVKGHEMLRIIGLNNAVDHLRVLRTALLSRRDQSHLELAPLHNELNAAATTIETSLTRALKRALVKVEANDLNLQKKLEDLSVDMGKTQNILPSIPNVLSLLDDEKTDFKKIVEFQKTFSDAQTMVHTAQEALANLKMEKYILSLQGLTQIRIALDNFDFFLQGEQADHGGKESVQMEELFNQIGVRHGSAVMTGLGKIDSAHVVVISVRIGALVFDNGSTVYPGLASSFATYLLFFASYVKFHSYPVTNSSLFPQIGISLVGKNQSLVDWLASFMEVSRCAISAVWCQLWPHLRLGFQAVAKNRVSRLSKGFDIYMAILVVSSPREICVTGGKRCDWNKQCVMGDETRTFHTSTNLPHFGWHSSHGGVCVAQSWALVVHQLDTRQGSGKSSA